MQNHPLHTTLLDANWHWRTLYRWLIAWWYYRSSGLACWIASGGEEEFWRRMLLATHPEKATSPLGKEWPRGKDRTHFRGNKAVNALRENQYIFGNEPGDMVRVFLNGAPSYQEIAKRVIANQTLDYKTAFVVCCDLSELDLCHVDFPESGCTWSYPTFTVNQLRTTIKPWTVHSVLAMDLIKILEEEPVR